MAETNQEGTNRPPAPKKELSMELRLLIAFVLMGVVMFTMPYFYKSPPAGAPKQAATTPGKAGEAPPAPSAAAKAVEAAPAGSPQAIPPIAAQKEEAAVIETDLYRIAFSNRGGTVTSWQLKAYKAASGLPLEIVNTASKVDRPFALYFKGRKLSTDLNQALFTIRRDADGLGVAFEYSDGNVLAQKSFHFEKHGYMAQISAAVTEGGKRIPSYLEWRGGFGDLAVNNPSGAGQTLHYDATSGKLVKNVAKAAKDGPAFFSGNYTFAGIEDTYFTATLLPEGASALDTVTFSDPVRTVLDSAEQPYVGTAVSDGAGNRFGLFVGPKDLDILRAVNPKLEQLVDFGWFGFLAKPLFLTVNWVTLHYIHNYGWTIIAVTVALNFVLFPLKITSMKSMRKMQALQPQIKAINEKYKGIGMRDPRKSDQNQEVMDLYKKHGVNPMGGCVPMLLQIPFFFAFYKVFMVSVEMRGANWLWVTDLSQPETMAIKILPLAMIASQFVMQKMTPQTGGDPSQQKMMMFMPLVLGFMFYHFSSGLILYYLTSNLVQIGQQWFFNRTSIAEALARSVEISGKKKNGRK